MGTSAHRLSVQAVVGYTLRFRVSLNRCDTPMQEGLRPNYGMQSMLHILLWCGLSNGAARSVKHALQCGSALVVIACWLCRSSDVLRRCVCVSFRVGVVVAPLFNLAVADQTEVARNFCRKVVGVLMLHVWVLSLEEPCWRLGCRYVRKRNQKRR